MKTTQLSFFTAAALAAFCSFADTSSVKVMCARASHQYAVGEKAEFDVTAEKPGTPVKICFSRAYLPPMETLLTTTPVRVSCGLGEPGFVVCKVQERMPNGGFGKQVAAGAGFEPSRIKTTLPPVADFDAFWDAAFKEQDAIAPDFKIERAYSNGVQLVSCQTVWGTRMYGFLHVPKGAKGPVPLMVNVGGGDSIVVQKHAVDAANTAEFAQRGYLFIHLPGFAPVADTWPESAALNKKWLEENKIAGGSLIYWNVEENNPRRRWYYRCILGSCRLIDYAVQQEGVDRARVYYTGASTGGGYGVFLAAFSPHIRAAVCEVPNYGNAGGPSAGKPSGEDDRGKYWQTSLYFDSAHCAPRITCPVFMSCGYTDNSCCPETVYAIYNQLRCKKVMYDKIENGHGDVPKGYYAVRKAWLEDTFGM